MTTPESPTEQEFAEGLKEAQVHSAGDQADRVQFAAGWMVGRRPLIARLDEVRKLHEPTLQNVEWFVDQTGKGEALCCPSCRPADPTPWHPGIGRAGLKPDGFVPTYVLSPCPTLDAMKETDHG
jgi:hypothetical protein